ncbi:MAG: hypothetical protein Hyperionvirus13_50 [Hyperionvirus sp.]|uniref:Uncharacterized protein n=1 Tax=Hyperionvirus sp. TaxID=2487770 RepID=A0A3G5A9G6_9VIRU|nr:MAG: hypothetical protein Hyperionvirus13_50 [Hyperionvirus sp.]
MNSYYHKYIKYKSKYLGLKDQLGGESEQYLDKVKALLKQKGQNYWFSSLGKLFLNAGSDTESLKKIVKTIQNDPAKYIDKEIIHVRISIWEDNDDVPAPVALLISVITPRNVDGKIALNLRDKKYSLSRFFLKPNEFNLSVMKQLAKIMLDKKLKNDNEYEFKDVKKYLTKN